MDKSIDSQLDGTPHQRKDRGNLFEIHDVNDSVQTNLVKMSQQIPEGANSIRIQVSESIA